MWEKVKKRAIQFFNDHATVLRKYTIYTVWTFLVVGFLTFLILFIVLSFSDLPTFSELENPEYDQASIIFDDQGVAFGKYYIENREPIQYDQLSPHVLNALLSTEDVRYFKHSGVDFFALARVAFKSLLLQKESSGGGSTISQQLAKLLFERPAMSSMSRWGKMRLLVATKFKEWIIAVKLEKSYTKEEIIAMYLNKFEFINGAHGIQAAAQTYFGKDQMDLEKHEAALLVGMLKNPSLFNPVRFPEKSFNRRNVVLKQMRKMKKIKKAEFDSLKVLAVDMTAFNRKTQSEGPAPYFRSELTKWLRQLFEKNNIRKSDGTPYDIYRDGLQIYTTIDLKFQQFAEESLVEHMKVNQEKYFNVWKGRDPWTYDADDVQKKIRADILERRIKASDRYLSMRNQYMSRVLSEINEKIGEFSLSDNVIKTLNEIKDGQLTLHEAVEMNRLSMANQSSYRTLMNHKDLWPMLNQAWNDLQKAYHEVFNSKVEMEVFDYSEEGYKTLQMSPRDSVRFHNMHLQAGLLAADPHTGYIKAWVGGIDHRYFKYDHVNSRRQVGSTIKPFVYATAIAAQGLSPCQQFDDIQYTIAPGDANFYVDKEWSPANADGKFSGQKYNLFQGLRQSKNSITVKLVKELGSVQVIREMLEKAGVPINFELPGGQVIVPDVPSICLGAVDLSLYEMTGAYTTFANNGMYTEPIFIKSITDKNGKVIYSGIPSRNLAINPVYNAVMVEMLKNNVGSRLGLKSEVGGKTGTTNDYSDGWFIGITPSLVTGVWVGGDDKWIRFLTLNDGQGSVMARPIFQKFLKKLEEDPDSGFDHSLTFKKPVESYTYLLDCSRYKDNDPDSDDAPPRKRKKDEFDDEFSFQ